MRLTAAARRMVAALDESYASRNRIEAQLALRNAIVEAAHRYVDGTDASRDAPALSPVRRARHPLRRYGWRWLLVDGYWIGFLADAGSAVITACFHQTSSGIGPVRRSGATASDR